MQRHTGAASFLFLLATTGSLHAAPSGLGTVAASERPYTLQEVQAKKQIASFGLCTLPQNADALPTQPVPVEEDQCHIFQRYEASSNVPTNGGSCGGFTVAFGALGDLKTNWKRYQLNARWGDEPLTQTTCPKARLAAAAWGARCMNADCSSAQWERIGVPLSKKGTWSANQNKCFLEHQFLDNTHRYKTLNIDVIATLQPELQATRKRASASIRAEKGNGKCFSTTQTPQHGTPAQPASQAGATTKPQQRP